MASCSSPLKKRTGFSPCSGIFSRSHCGPAGLGSETSPSLGQPQRQEHVVDGATVGRPRPDDEELELPGMREDELELLEEELLEDELLAEGLLEDELLEDELLEDELEAPATWLEDEPDDELGELEELDELPSGPPADDDELDELGMPTVLPRG